MRFDLERGIDEIFDLYLTLKTYKSTLEARLHTSYSSTIALASSPDRPHSLTLDSRWRRGSALIPHSLN